MKYLSLIVLLSFLTTTIVAQSPEPIPSMTRVQKSYDYYFEQSVLWERVVKKTPSNKKAWLYYFLAARYANHFSKEAQSRFDLEGIIAQAKEAIPESFEYYYIKYRLFSDCKNLYRANEIDPDRKIALHDLQTCYLVDGDLKNAQKYVEKWYETGDWSPSVFRWNYNVLASLAPNALMLSWGDNDSYPIYALQSIKKIRQDVGLIVMPLLWKDSYREHVFAQNEIAPFGKKSSDFASEFDYYAAIVDHIQSASNRPLYIGVAGSKVLKKRYEDSLYLVGLAYKFSPTEFDNISEIQDNYEHKFLLDDLKVNLSNDISRPIADQLNLNYIPSFLLLHDRYNALADDEKAKDLEQIITNIAKSNHQSTAIAKYFKKERPIKNTVFKVKDLVRPMKKIKNNLYASETEVSIGQYNQFIQDLELNKEQDILQRVLFAPTSWADFLTDEQKKKYANQKSAYNKNGEVKKYWVLNDEKFEPGNPSSPNYPIQNISWEAANEYCQWITKVYNSSTSRKKKFKKVIFRLPTEQEWELAAHGKKSTNFAWGTNSVQNGKGCFLCNFDAPDCGGCNGKNKKKSNDGAFFTAMVDAYFPNDFGLYNVTGNVAEMVQNQTITKGGGWNSRPEDCKISARISSEAPSPNIGFRVFMEVLESK